MTKEQVKNVMKSALVIINPPWESFIFDKITPE
jgi:23S rRNA A2030 N6-methylase RlmJ